MDVIIAGRIGKEPEMKYFDSGKVKTSLSIAVDGYDSVKKEKITEWHNIECWEKLAENVGNYFKKGSSVIVDGEYKSSTYKNKENEEVTRYFINARNVSYSKAYIEMNGIIENIEVFETQNNKKIQTIKILDNDIRVINFNDKIELATGQYLTSLCALTIKDNKPIAKAVKIDTVKGVNVEEEIPF